MEKQNQSLDWNNIWKNQMEKHNRNYLNCEKLWNNKDIVYEYDRMAQSSHWKHEVLRKIEYIKHSNKLKILDIGAGPGTHSIPLALKSHEITSVEPSETMLNCMIEKINKMGIKNIRFIKKRWEEVDLEKDLDCPYDVVIASFSLSTFDLKKAIEKINKASKRYVYILWHIGIPDWEKNYQDIWHKIHGKRYFEVPKTDLLFNTLCQINILPNIETYNMKSSYKFKNFNNAFDYFRNEFFINNSEQEEILRNYLKNRIEKENGHIKLKGSTKYAVVWWDKNRN
jgi:ubiquinone/menaquinone biosynthesis C-methylase UbiE